MINIVFNSNGSGDWVVVEKDGQELFSGHRVSPMDLGAILEQLGLETDLIAVTDEEMEEWPVSREV